jgi:glycosyltransferase involved in cell wall biosynthesis
MKDILSFVIPAKNEEESVAILAKKIESVCLKLKRKYEIIFVDDGSTDKTLQKLTDLRKKNKQIKVIALRGNWGKSMALETGFMHTKGEIIFTLDADLQDEPDEIPRFLKKIAEGYDLVSGWKKVRHDPVSKVIPSRILNFIIRKVTGVSVHDTNCGYKAYRREVVESLNLYGEQYRYIPVLAAKQNFKVGEIVVKHNPRKFGKSKFGIERNIKGFLDLLTVVFLTGYIRRPGHFFGGFGLLSFSGGFAIGLYITYLRITTGGIQFHQPLLILGMLLMIIGVQLIVTGLMGEMIASYNQKRESIENIIKNKYL